MVQPSGVARARSGSVWIDCRSPVSSANASIAGWGASRQLLTPSSLRDVDLRDQLGEPAGPTGIDGEEVEELGWAYPHSVEKLNPQRELARRFSFGRVAMPKKSRARPVSH